MKTKPIHARANWFCQLWFSRFIGIELADTFLKSYFALSGDAVFPGTARQGRCAS